MGGSMSEHERLDASGLPWTTLRDAMIAHPTLSESPK